MNRNLDLCRALLFEIQQSGADCPINRLRGEPERATTGSNGVAAAATPEAVRYHLRLLIDEGLIKETDRSQAGVPCVRLTSGGHELIELTRSDSRWRGAKQYVRDATGGVSLRVVRTLLTRWAVEGASAAGWAAYRRGVPRPYYHRIAPRTRQDRRRAFLYCPGPPEYLHSDAQPIDDETPLDGAAHRGTPAGHSGARGPYADRGRMQRDYDTWDAHREYSATDRFAFAPTRGDAAEASLPPDLV